jgi:tetratricopeptide (TPR) repeat protein
LPAFDVQAPLLSLPHIFQATLDSVPAQVPYVFARPDLVAQWQQRLNRMNGFKIGISWQGNSKYRGDRWRSIPLRSFAPLGRVPSVHLLSLQKGEGTEQLAQARDLFAVTDLGQELDHKTGPFLDTAAVMKCVDLVVTSDTAVAHLAGALGVPVWLALQYAPDWRWLLERPDCPWYPTMRLFRQKTIGDWHSLFEEIRHALTELTRPHGSGEPSYVEIMSAEGMSKALATAHQEYQAGRLQEAERKYRQILAREPENADALHLLGVIERQTERCADAIDHIGQAIQRNPDFAEAHNDLGKAHADLGRQQVATDCFRRALDLRPDFLDAQNNLGNALKAQGKLDEAIACYLRALEFKPDWAGVLYNLGNAFKEQGKLEQAIACYHRSLEIQADYVDTHNNLGNALKDQGKLDEAIACYQRALELQPAHADAHWNRALAWLVMGNWQEGWQEYEWRAQQKEFAPRRFSQPMWDGSTLAGKTILLHAEQGLGDTIQFVRYAPLVKQRGGTVFVECQKALVPLLQGFPGIDELFAQGSDHPAFDVHAPLLSLPRLFATSPESVPGQAPYLHPRTDLLARWQARLKAQDGFKIGICWQGNSKYRADRCRSIPLRYFAPLARVPGVRLLSLQKGEGTEQVSQVRDLFHVVDLSPELDETTGQFLDTAAVMQCLDLVVTSDTAVAHLAGALGVPVWLALPYAPDWRWLLVRLDSPWYPSMRLFRQKAIGDWSEVFERMAVVLLDQSNPNERGAELLKLNLGCGKNPVAGYVNVDKFGEPDVKLDLEQFPWPWQTSSVGEVLLNHALEHLGETTATYLGIIKELYRVCVADALIKIAVPHPRHDDFLADPTHVRAITPLGLNLFSKRKNREWVEAGFANSPLGLYLDVDLEVVSVEHVLDEPWATRYTQKQMTEQELFEAIRRYNNVVKEFHMVVKVVK